MINGSNPLHFQLIELNNELALRPNAQAQNAFYGLQWELAGNLAEAIKFYQQSSHHVAISRLVFHSQFMPPPVAFAPQPIHHEQSGCYYGTLLFNHYRRPQAPKPSNYPMPSLYPQQPVTVHIHNAYREIPHTVLQTQL
ncbi:MAG TPA: hypothetical protein PLD88_15670, partial [Candidatus Berkiella sp.]|nr:hypothetical protein [Candidatus Berkiella sp.]